MGPPPVLKPLEKKGDEVLRCIAVHRLPKRLLALVTFTVAICSEGLVDSVEVPGRGIHRAGFYSSRNPSKSPIVGGGHVFTFQDVSPLFTIPKVGHVRRIARQRSFFLLV